MTSEISAKYQRMQQIIAEVGSCIVAYSGGVDSAVVMAVAHRVLGKKALACIGISPSYPTREMRDAIKLAEDLGANFRTINTREYLDPNYAANGDDRCFYCKSDLYDRIVEIAKRENWGGILDGTNASDTSDYRPGVNAAREHGVRSPLLEAGITKAELRVIAAELGLPIWDKPAMACLSSRVPHGTAITPEILKQVESAEDVLVQLGFRQFRVRHHGDIARIELPKADFAKAVEQQAELVAGIRKTGYKHVTLDLAGFRAESDVAEAAKYVPLRVTAKA